MLEIHQETLLALIPQLSGKKVLVIGDLCLDEYIVGRAQRLSREAPVPVLEFQRRFTVPGAAANPALNIQALGGKAFIAGVVGADDAGQLLIQSLSQMGIEANGVVTDHRRATTVKTRILAEVSLHFQQQLVRVDRQERQELAADIRQKLIEYLEWRVAEADAVLVSDYRSGVVGQEIIDAISRLTRKKRKVVTVDSQGNLFQFQRFTAVKCNREEAEASLRMELKQDEDFERGGELLLSRLKAQAVLITRGSEGMSLVCANGTARHIPASNRSEVFDVTGAGDTVIATLTLALAAGASTVQAALLSNYAAGLVVRKLGNATTTQEELARAIRSPSP